ncbi:MAG: response regulator [Planctomycetota bacterium]
MNEHTVTTRVFLLEDSAQDRQFLDIVTRRAALDIDWQWCDSCAAGRTLLEAIAGGEAPTPDLAILDLRLGDGSGCDLLPDLRRSLPAKLPVVIFSTSSSEQDRACFTDEPNLRYLVKPQTMAGYDEIIAVIRDTAAEHGQRYRA